MSVAQWSTHRCFRPPMSVPRRQKIRAHLGRLGLPYLTLCVHMTRSPPRFPVGSSEEGTVRRAAVEYLQTFRLQLTLSLSGSIQGAAVGWVGVLLLEGDRVSVYCVEGHRFNLIMPEGPCFNYVHQHCCWCQILLSLKTVQSKNHPRQNRLSVAMFTKGWL